MNKLLFIALGLVANVSAMYEYTYAPFITNPNDYFYFELDVTGDAFYSTTYRGAKDANQEAYGVKVDSYIQL
jgi:hypothetical protein